MTLKELFRIHFIRAPYFHLPADTSVPVIMVGPGSGVAPFRSFWQDRQMDLRQLASFNSELASSRNTKETDTRGRRGEGDGSDTFGDMTLVYGCRNAKEDLYKGETSVAKDEGALTAVLTGYSREPGKPRVRILSCLCLVRQWQTGWSLNTLVCFYFKTEIHLVRKHAPKKIPQCKCYLMVARVK